MLTSFVLRAMTIDFVCLFLLMYHKMLYIANRQ
jgi:hypothetical protein